MARHPRERRIEICPMRPSDLDQVLEIERLSFRAPWSRQVFVEELERDWAHLDVLTERGPSGSRVVAFCNYWLVRDEVHILNIAAHPDERRKGHASRLLAHIVDFARNHGCRFITLEVRKSNHGAIKLYRSFGFRPVGIRPNYYVEENEDAVVMLLELATGTE
ncbi:MAG: ribosomal protein S18-alanine N-acetyltransferase [Deltaproteobacteria bacterium]|nr:ribosomal protein S18-alanine N-acetyltransferase [Deltaproteobacteria bacterium]